MFSTRRLFCTNPTRAVKSWDPVSLLTEKLLDLIRPNKGIGSLTSKRPSEMYRTIVYPSFVNYWKKKKTATRQ